VIGATLLIMIPRATCCVRMAASHRDRGEVVVCFSAELPKCRDD
jgi:hypothetical protein